MGFCVRWKVKIDMFETLLQVFLRLMGAWLALAGAWLAIEALIDIHRCRRLIFYQAVHLACAGSALALGMTFVLGL